MGQIHGDVMTLEILCSDLGDFRPKSIGADSKNVFCTKQSHAGTRIMYEIWAEGAAWRGVAWRDATDGQTDSWWRFVTRYLEIKPTTNASELRWTRDKRNKITKTRTLSGIL